MNTIEIHKEEIRSYKKLKIISEMAPIREYIKQLEKTHGCKFDEFEAKIKDEEESFELWDTYIEWKAYQEKMKELLDSIGEINNAQSFTVTG